MTQGGRCRGVFPCPVPRVVSEPIPFGTSRVSKRRAEERRHVDEWVRDIVIALNSMYAGVECDGSFDGQHGPTLSQRICIEKVRQCVQDAGKPPAELSGQGALDELRATAGYTGEPVTLAPLDTSLVSLPPKGSSAATMSMIFGGEAESFSQRLTRKLSAEGDVLRRKSESEVKRPYLDPSLRECPRKYAEFCRRLHGCGLTEYHEDYKEQVGAFAVWKKSGKQRLVIDARLANMHFEKPEKVQLATGSTFSRVEVGPGPEVEVGEVDISDAFYHIELMPCLRPYFALEGVKAEDVGIQEIEGKKVSRGQIIYPVLKVCPMGWSLALWLCQAAHQYVVDQCPGIHPSDAAS